MPRFGAERNFTAGFLTITLLHPIISEFCVCLAEKKFEPMKLEQGY